MQIFSPALVIVMGMFLAAPIAAQADVKQADHVAPPTTRPAADNSDAARASVLIVTEGNFFLERAAKGWAPRETTKIVSPGDYERHGSRGAQVVVFDRYQPKESPERGRLVFLGVTPPDSRLGAVHNGQPVTVHDESVASTLADDPLVRDLNFKKLFVVEARKLDVPQGWAAIVSGTDGPLVLVRREKQRVQVVVAFDLMKSNWPAQASFPQFLRRAVLDH